jgi:hypothetical protein
VAQGLTIFFAEVHDDVLQVVVSDLAECLTGDEMESR